MATLLASTRAPRCVSCLRPNLPDALSAPLRQQTRGKKKLPKSHVIKVRLLRDIPRYGRQGTIIPVNPGRMRNDLYPKQKAEYLTAAQLRETGMLHAKAERDWTFGTRPKAMVEQSPDETQSVVVDVLSPTRSMELLEELLPECLTFYRAPIATSQLSQKRSPSIPSFSAISAAAEELQEPHPPVKTGIHGSVSTADISANLRGILGEDNEGSRIVLSPEDIHFISEGEEEDRVKHLGTFDFEIRIKGASGTVRRNINVNSSEAQN